MTAHVPPPSAGVDASVLRHGTLARLFVDAAARRGDAVMMRQKELGIWQPYTWREVAGIVREVASGLCGLGVRPGQVVSILANTCREWVWCDLGALSAGAVVSGIYPTDAAAQVEYLCADSASVVLFVEDEEQLDKVLAVRERLPGLAKVVIFDMEGLSRLDDPQVMSLDALRALGRERLAAYPDEVEERIAGRGPDDLAILIYTSGTTGRPKGAMLSNGNVLHSVSTFRAVCPGLEGGERVCFLPLCHVAERNFGEYLSIVTGSVMNFVENPETVFENLREIQPTAFMAVPRIWEKLYSAVTLAVREGTPLERWAYGKAIATGQEIAHLAEAGTTPSAALRARYWLARRLVLDNVRRMSGLDAVETAVTGAAPISPDLIRWYRALGIEMIELWGMSELTGAGTCNPAGRTRPGSIGTALPNAEIRISDEGEIQVRGPQVFLGYLNQPNKTAETVVDGWLRTGDVGRIDPDGYFYITDRMKDIIITAGGKNITPSEWENQLKFSPYVTDAVVIGDRRAFLTCLVMIDHENVEQWAQERSVPFSDYRSLTRTREVQELIGGEIEAVNKRFARVEQIKAFRLIETKLTAEDEELTPTMKLKRRLVNEKYKGVIEEMYRAG